MKFTLHYLFVDFDIGIQYGIKEQLEFLEYFLVRFIFVLISASLVTSIHFICYAVSSILIAFLDVFQLRRVYIHKDSVYYPPLD